VYRPVVRFPGASELWAGHLSDWGAEERFVATVAAAVSRPYRPESFWSDRLSERFDLTGTGHVDYSHEYNDWLYRAKRRALRRDVPQAGTGDKALDIGSGVGWVVNELLALGYEVEGCDIADPAIEGLRTRFPGLTFSKVALGSDPLPQEDSSVDLVVALDVMYHVTDDARWRQGLSEIARVLKPGGKLVVSDRLGAEDYCPQAHVHFRSRATWSAAAEYGLELEAVRPYFRWLSRDLNTRFFNRLSDGRRGALEFALERLAPRRPHMRSGIFARR
jgi:SAM-dependent methyltransferase